LGRDLSGTGWGLKWDFIIIHESGHEWFANNITYKDVADMWIHESFTNYSESLFTEYYFGKKAASEYVIGTRKGIRNDIPIIGTYDLNKSGSSDMYPKGGNMLHTIRQITNNDDQWRQILRGLNKTFYHQTVTTQQIEDYLSKNVGRDLSKVFDQYLRDVRIPVLEYSVEKNKINYRWSNCVEGFDMPVKVTVDGGKEEFIYPTTTWKTIKGKFELKVDENFYVTTKAISK
jgi:aminopeptidase N